jgi:hypothetical protein
VEDVEELEYV